MLCATRYMKNMPIIKWRPFSDLDKFFEEEEWFAPLSRIRVLMKVFEPSMNIYQTEKEVVAEIDLPGIDPKEMEISIENNVLHIKGGYEEEKEEKGKDYYRKEIRKGRFERAVNLPVPVMEEKTKASYEDGILKITIPKQEVMRPRKRIPIKIKTKK